MDKDIVQKLRKVTGAGLTACLEAAQSSKGDFDKAVQILREKGRLMVDEKSMRLASEGMICIICDEERKYGVMLELNCETDFVAHNDCFVNLASEISRHILNGIKNQKDSSSEAISLSGEAWKDTEVTVNKINDTTLTARCIRGNLIKLSSAIEQLVSDATLKLREKIEISKCFIYQIDGPGFVTFYLHNKHKNNASVGRLGVLLAISGHNWQEAEKTGLSDRAYKVSMHIAAMQPLAVSREQLEPELVDRKTTEFKKTSDLANKPESIVEKILSGKMHKFYQEVVLMEQSFVMDDEKTVSVFWKEEHTSDRESHILRFDFLKVDQ